jgi:hypothetical protein
VRRFVAPISLCAAACFIASEAAAVERLGLTVVVVASPAADKRARAALAATGLPIDVEYAALPTAPRKTEPVDEIEPRLVSARKAYVAADFEACARALDGPSIPYDLVGAGRRELAARLLFWKTACLVGAGAKPDAAREALRFATLGLIAPMEVDQASPEVEVELTRAAKAVGAGARTKLDIRSDAMRAEIAIDGVLGLCTAPCSVEVAAGDHVLVAVADGFRPERVVVSAQGTQQATLIKVQPASPELAAEQWAHRYSGSVAIDTSSSLKLLSQAIRARRVLLLSIDDGPKVEVARASLIIDGNIVARGERTARASTSVSMAGDLMRDLLIQGRLLEPPPPIWKRPAFWITVGLSAATAAITTAAILYKPPTRTEVRF